MRTRRWKRMARLVLIVVLTCSLAMLMYAIAVHREYIETLDDQWKRQPFRPSTERRLKEQEHVDISINREPITNNDVVLPQYFRYRINSLRDKCVGSNYSLFIYVHSAIGNFARREMLRKTWASADNLRKYNVGLVFMTGMTTTKETNDTHRLVEESKKYDDIVQIDYPDTYKQISVKAAASLSWVAVNCAPYVDFVLKTDDDMFIELKSLIIFIDLQVPKYLTASHTRPALLCNVQKHDQVRRDNNSVWYISQEFYKKSHYPPFCPGSALLMTSSAVRDLYVSLIGSRLFPLDDVWITAILRDNTQIELVPINEYFAPDTKGELNLLDFDKKYLFAHCSPENLEFLWNWLTNNND